MILGVIRRPAKRRVRDSRTDLLLYDSRVFWALMDRSPVRYRSEGEESAALISRGGHGMSIGVLVDYVPCKVSVAHYRRASSAGGGTRGHVVEIPYKVQLIQ